MPQNPVAEPKSVYIASRYSRRKEMERHAGELTGQGWLVTSRWVYGFHDSDDRPMTIYAQEDMEDIRSAHWLLAFTEDECANPGYTRGGRHVELGMALAWGKNVVLVGPKENVFCHLPQVRQAGDLGTAMQIMEDSGSC